MRTSVARQGVYLTLFPLFCQLAFTSVLVWLLWHMQTEVERESQSRSLLSGMHNTTFQYASYLMETSMTGDHGQEGHVFIKQTLGDLKHLVDKVGEYIQVTPEQGKQMVRMKASLDKFAEAAHWAEEAKTNGQTNWDLNHAEAQRRICLTLVDFITEGSRFTDIEEESRENNPVRSQQTRQRVLFVLLGALIFTAVLAVVLGRLYAKRIEKPLLRIAENSQLLAKQQPLLPVLPGNNELADLDLLIHHVADAMNSAFERERDMIGNTADLICSLDENGIFTNANAFALNMLGMDSTALIGTAISDLTPGEYSARADEMVSICKTSGQLQRFDLPLRKANGTLVETRWSCFWSSAESSLFSVVHDTTEENKIARLKKDFLDMIGHELRAPLESILLTTQEVLDDKSSGLPDSAKSQVSSVSDNVRKMLSFANDLLNAQNLESDSLKLKIEPADISDMILESVGLVKHLASSKQIQIEMAPLDGAVKSVDCDRQKIVQTLTNLLSNAVKFSPFGGRVVVEVSNSISHSNPEKYIRFNVVDNGPGVPKESRGQIFGAFEQLSADTKQGTGLGLAICKSIVEAHGGTIGCDEVQAAGSSSATNDADNAQEHASSVISSNLSSSKNSVTPKNHDSSNSLNDSNSSKSAGSTFWFELPLHHQKTS